MEEKLSVTITVREEELEGKKVIIVSNEETGIADFGDNLEQAVNNFKKSLNMYFEAYPEKRELLIGNEEPVLVSKIFL